MKGIAISTIALFVIAIVSITILIAFFSSNLRPALRKGYCSIMLSLLGFLPIPEHLRPSLPPYCKPIESQKMVVIESSIPQRIAFEIASHVLACWKMTGEIGVTEDTYCYELVIRRLDGSVSKDDVMAELPSEYKDIVLWSAGTISTPKSLGIYYNQSEGKVVVE